MDKKVAILMATYNGEPFLRDQLDSIIRQSYPDWILYVMDDMSADSTTAIIDEYAAKDGRIVRLPNRTKRGAKGTFEALMRKVPRSEYYMFSDQDDVWMKEKIRLTLDKMLSAEAEGAQLPVVIHTDLAVVDASLSVISPSFWSYSRIAPSLLTTPESFAAHNLVTGCTMMFNEQARRAALPFSPRALMHDTWVALTALAAEGKIAAVEFPTMLYRQHGHNALGAKDQQTHYLRRKFRMLSQVIKTNADTYKMVREECTLTLFGYCAQKWRYYFQYKKLQCQNKKRQKRAEN